MYKLGMTKDQLNYWISAMESGDFKFGRKEFYKDGCDGTASYCALGVLCAINDIPYKQIDEIMGEGIDNYNALIQKFFFDKEGYVRISQIYEKNDNENDYQLVIDFLKNHVEADR